MDKSAARTAAFARRKFAHQSADRAAATAALSRVLARFPGAPLAGYMPMRTEIDPLPAMTKAARSGPVGVPVISGPNQPLEFRQWRPEAAMVEGAFGALIPETGEWITPEVVIVPLVAFTARGDRLGYGGGFYDRTLERLRAARPTVAIGFAYAAQKADHLPLEPTDQPLDLIVTEEGVITP